MPTIHLRRVMSLPNWSKDASISKLAAPVPRLATVGRTHASESLATTNALAWRQVNGCLRRAGQRTPVIQGGGLLKHGRLGGRSLEKRSRTANMPVDYIKGKALMTLESFRYSPALRFTLLVPVAAMLVVAQNTPATEGGQAQPANLQEKSAPELKQGWQRAADPAAKDPSGGYTVDTGTRIPLALINSVSTKHAVVGDRVYLETVFPVVVKGKMVIPPGSYVLGTVTQVKRPGRVKGRGELYVRFDSLTLPNGVVRDFRSRVGNMDGTNDGSLDREEGTIKGDSDKGGDARRVAGTTITGTSVGTLAGAATGNWGRGMGIGAAAGAAAGLVGVLVTRGPEVVLARGSTLEMVLDRDLEFESEDLATTPIQRPAIYPATPAVAPRDSWPLPGSRSPF